MSAYQQAKVKQLQEIVRIQENRGVTSDTFPFPPDLAPKPLTPSADDLEKLKKRTDQIKAIKINQAVLADKVEQTPQSAEKVESTTKAALVDLPTLSGIKSMAGDLDLDGPLDAMLIDWVKNVLIGLKFTQSEVNSISAALNRAYGDNPQPPTKSDERTIKDMKRRLTEIERSIEVPNVPFPQQDEYYALKNDILPTVQQFLSNVLDEHVTQADLRRDFRNFDERVARGELEKARRGVRPVSVLVKTQPPPVVGGKPMDDGSRSDAVDNMRQRLARLMDTSRSDAGSSDTDDNDAVLPSPGLTPIPTVSTGPHWSSAKPQQLVFDDNSSSDSPRSSAESSSQQSGIDLTRVVNPETGFTIKIGGPTYQKLVKSGKYTASPMGNLLKKSGNDNASSSSSRISQSAIQSAKKKLKSTKDREKAAKDRAYEEQQSFLDEIEAVLSGQSSPRSSQGSAPSNMPLTEENFLKFTKGNKGSGVGKGKRGALKLAADGTFGKLKIDMEKFRRMELHVKKGRKLVARGKLSHDLMELLTKRYNPRINYSEESIAAFRKLVELSGLPVPGGGKGKILRGLIKAKPAAAAASKPKTQTKYVYFSSPDELVERLHVLVGSIDAGNQSPEVKQEASQLLDRLKNEKVISETQYVTLLESI